MDAIALLTTQHAEIEAVFEKLARETDEFSCHELVGRLVDRLTLHTALEEEFLYPAIAALPDGGDLARRAGDEHSMIERMLEPLRDLRTEKRVYIHDVNALHRAVREHVAEEENAVLPMARTIAAVELREMGEHMEARIRSGEVATMHAIGA